MLSFMDFGNRLRTMRKASGLTQVELAKRARVAQATVSELERGASKAAHSETLIALAKVLSCSPEWLSTGKGSPSAPISSGNPDLVELAQIFNELPPNLRAALMTTARSLLAASSTTPTKANPYPKARA